MTLPTDMTPTISGPASPALPIVYQFPQYLFRRKMLKLLGGRLDIYEPSGKAVMCCLQKAFKLREDIRLFTDDTQRQELLTIKARNIIDFSAAYDVTDALTGQAIGTLRRKGWKSMVRDEWEILDPREYVVGMIQEDSTALAIVRRLVELGSLIPQSFHVTATSGATVATLKQHFDPFVHKMDLHMPTGPTAGELDPRLLIAATTLVCLIEGRQQ